jgi:hypothetical protein
MQSIKRSKCFVFIVFVVFIRHKDSARQVQGKKNICFLLCVHAQRYLRNPYALQNYRQALPKNRQALPKKWQALPLLSEMPSVLLFQ